MCLQVLFQPSPEPGERDPDVSLLMPQVVCGDPAIHIRTRKTFLHLLSQFHNFSMPFSGLPVVQTVQGKVPAQLQKICRQRKRPDGRDVVPGGQPCIIQIFLRILMVCQDAIGKTVKLPAVASVCLPDRRFVPEEEMIDNCCVAPEWFLIIFRVALYLNKVDL